VQATLWGSGGNLQNQPPQAYPMFCCEKGYVLFYADGSQAEARVVGWLASIQKWIEQFEMARLNPGSYDAHRALASDMWGIPYDEIPTKDVIDGKHTLRYIAKRCRHGLNYRMGPDRLAETTGLSLREATEAYARYHRLHPELRQWWDELEGEVRRTGVLYSLLGRRWMFTESVFTEGALESIVAFKPQSTIGDKVNRVIYLCHEDDRWPTHSRIALNTHDGVVGIAREDEADRCLAILTEKYEEPILVPGQPPLIIPCEVKRTYTGTSWQFDEETRKFTFHSDEKGLHRWSDLEGVHLAA
jgi:hypothetical protein